MSELLRPEEVSQMFGVHSTTVRSWARAGLLSTIRTPGGHRRYRAAEVKALMDAGFTPARCAS